MIIFLAYSSLESKKPPTVTPSVVMIKIRGSFFVDCDCLIDIENGSENSKGAMLEKMICMALGIPIISLSSFLSYKATYKYSTTNLEMKQ